MKIFVFSTQESSTSCNRGKICSFRQFPAVDGTKRPPSRFLHIFTNIGFSVPHKINFISFFHRSSPAPPTGSWRLQKMGFQPVLARFSRLRAQTAAGAKFAHSHKLPYPNDWPVSFYNNFCFLNSRVVYKLRQRQNLQFSTVSGALMVLNGLREDFCIFSQPSAFWCQIRSISWNFFTDQAQHLLRDRKGWKIGFSARFGPFQPFDGSNSHWDKIS